MRIILLLTSISLLLGSCYKDKGNYDIAIPLEPTITNLDTLYEAIVGDSLIISPKIEGIPAEDLELTWRIDAPESKAGTYVFKGTSLRIVFGLQANRYGARLTISNTRNGMKYFHKFKIQGITEFVRGATVLSVDNGSTYFSFVKPNNMVQPNIYEAINGKKLPSNPLHLFYMRNANTGNTPLGYWIITKEGGVRLNVSTLQEDPLYPNSLAANFFSPPEKIEVGSLKEHVQGVLMGVINGKFYGGTTSTWDQAVTYGMFGTFSDGAYDLDPKFIMSTIQGATSIIGFDRVKKQFLRFNIYGDPVFFGTQYGVINPEVFNPMSVNMDLVEFVQSNNSETYAYCKDNSGQIHEFKFTVNFNGPFNFTAVHKRPFIRQSLFNETTKIVAARNGLLYIASNNAVYRYNPLNQELRELDTKFTMPVTMVKLTSDELSLAVGAGNSIYYLDIQVGQFGKTTERIDGIPGNPIDMAWRK